MDVTGLLYLRGLMGISEGGMRRCMRRETKGIFPRRILMKVMW